MLLLKKLSVPSAIPYPIERAPSPDLCTGFQKRSLKPEEIVLNSFTGFPAF